jgi:hypothetical protein
MQSVTGSCRVQNPKPKGPAMGQGTGERFRVWVTIPFVQRVDLLVNWNQHSSNLFFKPESEVLHKRKEPPKLIITMFCHQQSKILMKNIFAAPIN